MCVCVCVCVCVYVRACVHARMRASVHVFSTWTLGFYVTSTVNPRFMVTFIIQPACYKGYLITITYFTNLMWSPDCSGHLSSPKGDLNTAVPLYLTCPIVHAKASGNFQTHLKYMT